MQPIISVTAPTPTSPKPNVHGRIYRTTTFFADAALFDMDGTLTDSIAAVEAAWSKVAREIGEDPAFVIAATHGKRAIDNLARFRPHLRAHELSAAVDDFERSILFYADAHSRARDSTPSLLSDATSSRGSTSSSSSSSSPSSGNPSTSSSLAASAAASTEQLVSSPQTELAEELVAALSDAQGDGCRAWELEAAEVDRAVRILPGVKALLESIPKGRYAIATSGARTYAHGCLARVGITPPEVTITADDPRLRAGKPAPDPFLLAAECLGYQASRCVVFEDSPSGIKAGVASGAVVIAVCTSHSREQIEGCGAQIVVENLEDVSCEEVETDEGLRLMFTVEH
ncbi:HAD-like domain-containing protein [Multifurca ochricompacta]|uniref:HAD-like domain-containing protein n=1 Tax=Multifurca ochricompacta TaxID=376703 RepID=A0AAD4M5Y7_9AGAM|nr:HAD-like domain-containing protein [Multifurca ochricompacta]